MKLIILLLSLLFCQATGFSTSGRRNTRNSIGCAFSANVQSPIQTSTESRDISLQLQNDSDASDVDRVTMKQKIEVCLSGSL
jgi:hypothetical protein